MCDLETLREGANYEQVALSHPFFRFEADQCMMGKLSITEISATFQE